MQIRHQKITMLLLGGGNARLLFAKKWIGFLTVGAGVWYSRGLILGGVLTGDRPKRANTYRPKRSQKMTAWGWIMIWHFLFLQKFVPVWQVVRPIC